MSAMLDQLLAYLDTTLEPGRFRDYCPNGLQVEGRQEITRLATGVTANQALLDSAIEWGADAILVHHGYFWKGEPAPVVGMKQRRLGALLRADVSLLAYHLPLDAHPELGNNACLGRLLGVQGAQPLDPLDREGVGSLGDLPEPLPMSALLQRIQGFTGRETLHVGSAERQVQRLAWCTEMDEAARAHEKVISATSGVYDGHNLVAAASSNGFSDATESTSLWIFVASMWRWIRSRSVPATDRAR